MAGSERLIDLFLARSIWIRPMTTADLPGVLSIEEIAFDEPRSDDCFYMWMRRCSHIVCCVAELRGVVVGYLVYEICDEHCNVIKVAVHEEFRQEGIGRTLITQLQTWLHQSQKQAIYLLIHERDLVAHLFFQAVGFYCFEIKHYGDGDHYRFGYSRNGDPIYFNSKRTQHSESIGQS